MKLARARREGNGLHDFPEEMNEADVSDKKPLSIARVEEGGPCAGVAQRDDEQVLEGCKCVVIGVTLA